MGLVVVSSQPFIVKIRFSGTSHEAYILRNILRVLFIGFVLIWISYSDFLTGVTPK